MTDHRWIKSYPDGVRWDADLRLLPVQQIHHPKMRAGALRSLQFCGSGGARLPGEVAQRFAELTGCKLNEGWGMTETSPTGTFTPVRAARVPERAHRQARDGARARAARRAAEDGGRQALEEGTGRRGSAASRTRRRLTRAASPIIEETNR
ncbi:MAG TPA: AMP-binding protein [Burkholderiaceae bacterium]|nr:AMP-binding protein [Burkholderiaceae bacterium]